MLSAESATWRRGAQGGKHSGEPLCNKCGVWEFRHPDSPPRDEVSFVSSYTASTLSYHTLHQLCLIIHCITFVSSYIASPFSHHTLHHLCFFVHYINFALSLIASPLSHSTLHHFAATIAFCRHTCYTCLTYLINRNAWYYSPRCV